MCVFDAFGLKMNYIFEDKLIRAVKSNPCIYDKNNRHFRDRMTKDKIWKGISLLCGKTVEQCQTRWRTLRDRFVREINKAVSPHYTPIWRFYEPMLFISDFVALKEPEIKINNRSLSIDYTKSSILDIAEADDYELEMKDEACYEETMSYRSLILQDSNASENIQDTVQSRKRKLSNDFDNVIDIKYQIPDSMEQLERKSDPFYECIEYILQKVDPHVRDDIKVEVLNFVHEKVKQLKS